MSNPALKQGRAVVSGLVLLLIVLHHDFWNWDSTALVFGFIPLTLFWHICISIGASATWFLATRIAWPEDLEAGADSANHEEAAEGGRA